MTSSSKPTALWRHLFLSAALCTASAAQAVPVSFTQLTGVAGGGAIPATGVYKADLSALGGVIQSITITDNSGGVNGASGQFSAFDLDAIKLSNTDCTTAACASSAVGLSLFDFLSATFFTPGTQRAPTDPKLFGTGPTGNTVDDPIATLGLFDGVSSTLTPFGFISLGDNGVIAFNLSAAVSTAGLFLYIGEVGNNGEVAASNIEVRSTTVPEPGTLGLLGIGLAGLGFLRRRKV